MAVKKSELYSSLWASCDSLRGGMDSSQYKDYILTLLFVKYVSDKFKGLAYGDIEVPAGGSFNDMLALRGTKNIGEDMDIIIACLAEANGLRGVIDKAHFNDESMMGRGQEIVDRLTDLLNIFNDQVPDFSKNSADQVAISCAVEVLVVLGFVAFRDFFFGLFLERGRDVEQRHGGPKILINAVFGPAGKLFDADFFLQRVIQRLDAPAHASTLSREKRTTESTEG